MMFGVLAVACGEEFPGIHARYDYASTGLEDATTEVIFVVRESDACEDILLPSTGVPENRCRGPARLSEDDALVAPVRLDQYPKLLTAMFGIGQNGVTAVGCQFVEVPTDARVVEVKFELDAPATQPANALSSDQPCSTLESFRAR